MPSLQSPLIGIQVHKQHMPDWLEKWLRPTYEQPKRQSGSRSKYRVKRGLGRDSYIVGSKDSHHSGPTYFYSELLGEALCKRLGPLFHGRDIVSGCRMGVDQGGLIRLGERTSAIAGVENEVRNDSIVGNVVNLDTLVRMEDHRRWYAVSSFRQARGDRRGPGWKSMAFAAPQTWDCT